MRYWILIVSIVFLTLVGVIAYDKSQEWENRTYSMVKLLSLDEEIEKKNIETTGWVKKYPGEGTYLYLSKGDMRNGVFVNSVDVKFFGGNNLADEYLGEGKLCDLGGVFMIYSGRAFMIDVDSITCGKMTLSWSSEGWEVKHNKNYPGSKNKEPYSE